MLRIITIDDNFVSICHIIVYNSRTRISNNNDNNNNNFDNNNNSSNNNIASHLCKTVEMVNRLYKKIYF